MASWKELGVVPDSDEEDLDWDSDTPPNHQPPPEPRTDDGWAAPGAPAPPPISSFNFQRTRQPTVEPQPSAFASIEHHVSHLLGQHQSPWALPHLRHSPHTIKEDSPEALADVSTEASAYSTPTDRVDHNLPSIVAIHAPSADLFPGQPSNSVAQDAWEAHHTEESESRVEIPANAESADLPSPIASRVPLPSRRTLRPRKPIQEHPYLLENAQYSKTFKSHGLKPIRIAVAEQLAAKRRQEEDSQETDYPGDGSQSAGLEEESQNRARKITTKVLDDDLDELALSQSPKTSSPQRHMRASSEQSPGQHTDDTSVHDDEDFPDIRDLLSAKQTKRSAKLRTLPEPSTSRKRFKAKPVFSERDSPLQQRTNVWDLPLSPGPLSPISRTRDVFSPDDSSQPSVRLRAVSRSVSRPDKPKSPRRPRAVADLIDLTALTADSEDEPESRDSSSDSESDLIRRTGRKIRGVLPASWLRLDQHTRENKAQRTLRRLSPYRAADQPRQGLASKTAGVSKPSGLPNFFLDELDDNSDDENSQQIPEKATYGLIAEQGIGDDDNLDLGDASLLEEDYIDPMLPVQKRKRVASAGPRKRHKAQHKALDCQKRYRQPKISESVRRMGHPSNRASRLRTEESSCRRAERAASPPALSIVDFIEPKAPNFVKVAARAARQRKSMGRCKPAFKTLNLGNRTDNLDAQMVLQSWKSGKIKQRAPQAQSATQQERPLRPREPLRSVTSNSRRLNKFAAGLSLHQSQKLTRQFSMADAVSMKEREISCLRQPTTTRQGYRPAQLEAEVLRCDDNLGFGVRKKMLDLIFRKSRKEVLAPTFQLRPSSPGKERQSDALEGQTVQTDLGDPQLGQQAESIARKVFRPRKPIAPKRLDIRAPQYLHANDPLSFLADPSVSAEKEAQPHLRQEVKKITGLGPLGTHYTQHFDVFPLHRDTYFHHTTIIGNGTLKKALDYQTPAVIMLGRPVLSFEFSDTRFQWGPWTGTTSSELGLLFDAIAEDIEQAQEKESLLGVPRAVDGAENVLNYVLEFVSVNDHSELRSFAQRILELLDGFLSNVLHSNFSQTSSGLLVQITSRFLICALVLLRTCQSSVELSNEAQQTEGILQRLAKVSIERLFSIGLSEIRTAYDNLQRLGFRERGIRAENVNMISWVVVIKVLRSAQMPRTGFWDLVSSIVAGDITHVNDAKCLESLWRDMFTLLPLTEFEDAGILRQGMRHEAPLPGWTLPQMLLKVVFESYQISKKQSPSFNDYCRALLGRCHYLIDQWGWYKCVGVIGTIFDFFGGQELSHLRNEEVYQSPRFLEELSDGPILSVEPQDRCFHIFLKILAVAIRTLRSHGLANDIRNLIARCLPNHNRQYSKEMAILSHDLASLRNHHDLLCVLFWAAPDDCRRPVELIKKLVQPANSHKEACLINLRAWSQLARFVVSSGCSIQEYRPFMSWQNNMFHQVLNQYLSAPADLEHQFMSMAKEDRGNLQQNFLDSVVAANQNATKDVLYLSVVASLDVMKHCPSLTAAMFSFNVNQMAKVFGKLCSISNKVTDLDWGMLRAAFDTVDVFVKRIEDLCRRLGESSDASGPTDSTRERDDAVEFLDDKVVESFMSAVRTAMASPACAVGGHSAATVAEKAIILCGRIASLFIDRRKCSLSQFFSDGKYKLFRAIPAELEATEWIFVPLFVATLLQNQVFNFSSIGCTQFDVWISCLVKPFYALRYGIHLAEILNALDKEYMKGTGNIMATALTYAKNRSFFEDGICYMRNKLRYSKIADRKATRTEFEKLLKAVMQQIKSDVRSLELNSAEHFNYISFIRDIVGLIKSHGADICSVDPFFYQVSAEYSPSREDPQLHTAMVLAYGIRLGEGDTKAVTQVFYFLYNHFKLSLSSGQLDAESKIIENGMRNDHILAFVIGRMLPAIIRASSHSSDLWPLLRTYSKALQDVLARSCLPREIPEHSIDDVVVLLTAVLDWVRGLRKSSAVITATQAHIFTDLVGICNAARPSLASWQQQYSTQISRVRSCAAGLTRMAKQAAAVLDQLRALGTSEIGLRDVQIRDLIQVDKQRAPSIYDNKIDSFAQFLIGEVENNWVVTSDTVTVRVAAAPSTQRSKQAIQGVHNNLHSRVGLSELLVALKAWIKEMGEDDERAIKRRRQRRSRRIPPNLTLDPF